MIKFNEKELDNKTKQIVKETIEANPKLENANQKELTNRIKSSIKKLALIEELVKELGLIKVSTMNYLSYYASDIVDKEVINSPMIVRVNNLNNSVEIYPIDPTFLSIATNLLDNDFDLAKVELENFDPTNIDLDFETINGQLFLKHFGRVSLLEASENNEEVLVETISSLNVEEKEKMLVLNFLVYHQATKTILKANSIIINKELLEHLSKCDKFIQEKVKEAKQSQLDKQIAQLQKQKELLAKGK